MLEAIIYTHNWSKSLNLYKLSNDIHNTYLQELKNARDTIHKHISEKKAENILDVIKPDMPLRTLEWEELFLNAHINKLKDYVLKNRSNIF